ncbi:MAG TPA: hypothetical protein VEA36_02365, partial [Candidatus Paceibacterota bacterium]|nr:hypothetical protein [Candidatus Paceibacterota bacterium]
MSSIRINTVVSNVGSGFVALLLGSLVGVIMSLLVLEFSGLSSDWWFLGFFIPMMLIARLLFSPQPELPVGNNGILKVFGERWTWVKFSEGKHGLLLGMSIEETSVQLKTTKPREVSALSKDNVKMMGLYFMTYYVRDMEKFQSSDEPLRSLEQKGDSKFRDGIGGSDSETLEEPET